MSQKKSFPQDGPDQFAKPLEGLFPEELLDAYLMGTISEKDHRTLMQWFDGFSDEEVHIILQEGQHKAFIKEQLWGKVAAGIRDSGKEASAGKFLPLLPGNKKSGESKGRLYYFNRIAAACILLMVISWWARNRYSDAGKDNTAKISVAGQKTLLTDQSHNGAFLTLGSGQVIRLDSGGNGQLAVEGGVRILQQGARVEYEHGGDSSRAHEQINTMTTPRGKQFALVLPDGTKVWLNAASSITYPVRFAADRRKVSVTGEAYFEVAHLTAPDHSTRIPFEVQSGAMTVEVLGTHFDVQNYPDEVQLKTTLLQGLVRVHYGENGDIRQIQPGQQARIQKAGSGRILVKNVDLQQAVAWKDGLFDFKDEPLSDILRQVARWYDVEVFADPAKSSLRFSGVVSKRAQLSDLLDVLSATGVVQFRIDKNKVYGY